MKKIFSIVIFFISLSVAGQQQYKVSRLSFSSDEENEMAPVIYKNGIVFSSDKKSSVMVVTTDQNNKFPYNLYFVELKGQKWGHPNLFSSGITSKLSESSATFSKDYSTMYITRSLLAEASISQAQKADTIRNGIFECTPVGKDEWIASEAFYFNDTEYDVAFPSLSTDGELLFFASRAPGGFGGYDIYVSTKQGASWSEPKNLGAKINTSENEVFPFYHSSGRLYFSSKGHNSQGKLDIFYSEERKGEWIKPINLPKPFNSRQDDFGYSLSVRMDTGYFSSNRRGSDDIYMFTSGFPMFKDCPEQVDESFCYYFSETGSVDLDTNSLKYEWDFGDGYKVRSLEAEHCYAEVGTYAVSLNVIDIETGEIYFSEASYDLLVQPAEQPYIAAIDTVQINKEFTLDGKLSEIRSFPKNGYYWDFGDGNLETGMEVKHSYSSPGEYYIRLGITDGEDDVESEKFNIDHRACSQRRIVVVLDE
jgi:hypothetical protein